MIIGHLAGGYLAARGVAAIGGATFFAGILVGSVVPDADMLWFFIIDGQQTHHHNYLTHRPAVWAGVLLLAVIARWTFLIGVGFGALLHLVLDSIAGKIAWAWPISDVAAPLVVVPATQSHWVLSFLLHWTFAVEIALCLVALVLFVRTRSKTSKGAAP